MKFVRWPHISSRAASGGGKSYFRTDFCSVSYCVGCQPQPHRPCSLCVVTVTAAHRNSNYASRLTSFFSHSWCSQCARDQSMIWNHKPTMSACAHLHENRAASFQKQLTLRMDEEGVIWRKRYSTKSRRTEEQQQHQHKYCILSYQILYHSSFTCRCFDCSFSLPIDAAILDALESPTESKETRWYRVFGNDDSNGDGGPDLHFYVKLLLLDNRCHFIGNHVHITHVIYSITAYRNILYRRTHWWKFIVL